MISMRALGAAMRGAMAVRQRLAAQEAAAANQRMIRSEQKIILARHLEAERERAIEERDADDLPAYEVEIDEETRIRHAEQMRAFRELAMAAERMQADQEMAAEQNEASRIEREAEAEQRRVAEMAAMMARRQAKRS